jgi:peptidoglycan/xylan/chitin deacetylase (PgdA/CDA1 family)
MHRFCHQVSSDIKPNMKRYILLGLIFLVTPWTVVADDGCGPRQVALTFDDPPLPDTVVMTGQERTERIISALQEGGVDGAMFFAVSSRIDDDNIGRIHAYVKAGHVLASHSHTHPNLHLAGSEIFLEDVETAHLILADMPGFQQYFRFPYLNEGNTQEQRDEVRSALARMGYKQGYVTIDNYDFYIDRLIREAVEANGEVDLNAVGGLYVEMIIGAAEHYDKIACTWLGRSPRHVLLLHENDVAALFLPRLISAFRDRGWELISAIDAFEDPIANSSGGTGRTGRCGRPGITS